MGYQRYECSKCERKYYVEAEHDHAYQPPKSRPKCPSPSCHKHRLTMGRHLKNKPLDASPVDSVALSRPRRSSMGKQEVENYDFLLDEDELANEVEIEDDDDGDFIPPARGFNIAMRYHGGRHDVRNVFPTINYVANSTWTQIGMPAGRSDTAVVMGKAINNGKRLTAHAHSGRGVPYKKDKFNSDEWSHLIADSLGGPTTAGNLVAATYGANTFMAVIESKIQRNNKLDVKVRAYCSAAYVAEHIVYKLRATGNSGVQVSFSIDASCQDFNQTDADYYGKQVTDWLTQNKLKKDII